MNAKVLVKALDTVHHDHLRMARGDEEMLHAADAEELKARGLVDIIPLKNKMMPDSLAKKDADAGKGQQSSSSQAAPALQNPIANKSGNGGQQKKKNGK